MRERKLKPISESDYNKTDDRQSRFTFAFHPDLEKKRTRLQLRLVTPDYSQNGTQFLRLTFEVEHPTTGRIKEVPLCTGYTVAAGNKTDKLLKILKINPDACGYANVFKEVEARKGQHFRAVFERDRENPALFRIAINSLRCVENVCLMVDRSVDRFPVESSL